MIQRNVALDLAIQDQIGYNAMGFIDVYVLLATKLQSSTEGIQIQLMGLFDDIDTLEEIPIDDVLESLHQQIDTETYEEVFVTPDDHIEFAGIALLESLRKIMELQDIVTLQDVFAWHVAEQHPHRHQIDEDQSFIVREIPGTVFKGKGEELIGTLVVLIVHCLPAHKILVCDLLRQGELILKGTAIDGTHQWLTQMQFIDAEIHLEQLIDQIQHSQTLGIVVGGSIGVDNTTTRRITIVYLTKWH